MTNGQKRKSAIIFGVGAAEGLGAALTRRFVAEGMHVYMVGRTAERLAQVVDTVDTSAGGLAEAVVADVAQEAQVLRVFEQARSNDAAHLPELIVFNAGNNASIPLTDLTAAQIEAFWRVGCFGGFLVGREAANSMLPLGRGTIIFTGASASLRGRPGYAHFSAAKAGLRMLSQSMARELGPAGIHVAHVVIDGGIDGERLRLQYPEQTAEIGPGELLDIDALADAYWYLHCQHRSAWTQEIDLRPFKEPF